MIHLRGALTLFFPSFERRQTGQSFKVVGDAEVEVPEDERLGMTELQEGEGEEEVRNGDTVTVGYVGTLEADGHEFDRSDTFDFTVGDGDVIKGSYAHAHTPPPIFPHLLNPFACVPYTAATMHAAPMPVVGAEECCGSAPGRISP